MTRIIQGDWPNRCTLRYTDDDGIERERDFFAPIGGGYVREDWANPRQVCDGLASRGGTLTWDPTRDPTLADLIRRERRVGLRRARRFWSRI